MLGYTGFIKKFLWILFLALQISNLHSQIFIVRSSVYSQEQEGQFKGYVKLKGYTHVYSLTNSITTEENIAYIMEEFTNHIILENFPEKLYFISNPFYYFEFSKFENLHETMRELIEVKLDHNINSLIGKDVCELSLNYLTKKKEVEIDL